jgi:hypothetical protein
MRSKFLSLETRIGYAPEVSNFHKQMGTRQLSRLHSFSSPAAELCR